METLARLIVDLGRLEDGTHEHLKGCLSRDVLELDDLEQLHPAGDIEYDLQCDRLGDELLVRGHLTLGCDCICSRCGCDFYTQFLESSFCESLEIQGLDTIDLTDSVREGIILALPTYPICKEECQGVCLRCGQDLNAGPCRCAQQGVSSPWDALDQFTPQAENE